MAKKKKAWLSPKKQKILEEAIRRNRKKKVLLVTALSVVSAVALAAIIVGIVLVARPYYADIEIEGYGTITVVLKDSEAPITVERFIELAESGFYDGTTFNKVINEYLICGGYKENGELPAPIKGEFKDNGVENDLSHLRGTIVMLRDTKTDEDTDSKYSDFYDTARNEFYIMQRDDFTLDGYYATFGTIIDGMEIVDKICAEVKTENDDGLVAKENRPVIKTITIRRSEK